MTVHSTAFEAEQPARPIAAAAALLAADQNAFVAAVAPAAPRKLNLRKLLSTAAALAVLAASARYGWDYWTVGRYLVSTDDAYVRADSATIAPTVAGYLLQVLVKDDERVRTGQVLARIDDRDFKAALDQAAADVAAAKATIASKQIQLDVQEAVINAAKATLDVDRAVVTFAGQENKRYTDLAASGSGIQNAQQAAFIGLMIFAASCFMNTATVVTKREQFHSNIIGQSVTPGREEVRSRIVQSTDYFLQHGVSDPAAAHQQAIIALGRAVKHQALVMGFSDTFAVIGAVLALAALAVLLTREVKGAAEGAH
jgi:membrane fusion protein (multidrug efflux system)